MSAEILQGVMTTRDDKDTRLNRLDYYNADRNQEIATREMGWIDAFNDFIDYSANVSELEQEGVTGDEILEIKSITRRRPVDSDNANSQAGITGGLSHRATRIVIYGKQRKLEIELRAGAAPEMIWEFRKQFGRRAGDGGTKTPKETRGNHKTIRKLRHRKKDRRWAIRAVLGIRRVFALR